MFYRHHNLKRAIGLLGVVLALLSGVQQGHSFCYLAGCDFSLSSLEKAGQGSDRLTNACPCSRTCSRRPADSSATESSEGRNLGSPSDSCPCPTTCWCHQSPEPLSLPASAPGPVELLTQSTELVTATMDFDLGSLHSQKTTAEGSPETAMLRCAKLCRFLI